MNELIADIIAKNSSTFRGFAEIAAAPAHVFSYIEQLDQKAAKTIPAAVKPLRDSGLTR